MFVSVFMIKLIIILVMPFFKSVNEMLKMENISLCLPAISNFFHAWHVRVELCSLHLLRSFAVISKIVSITVR